MNGAKELLKAFYITIITAFIVSAVIVLILEVTFLILDSDSTPSEIINYHPTVFKEEAVEPFFYSIGTELKRSKAIDPHARTLFSCEKIWEAFVSPDNRMILLICGGRPEDGMLWLVSFDGGIRRKVVEVKDIDKKRSTPGEYFIKGDGIQWSPDSQSFYVIRDQYSSEGRHTLTPLNGSLLRYDVGQERFEEVIQKFPSY